MAIKLITAKIENFKSLGNVELSFRDLTIIVGSNSSGKSNSLDALDFLRDLLVSDSLPVGRMTRILRFGSQKICASLVFQEDKDKADYSVCLAYDEKNSRIVSENLEVNGIQVIKINNGEGEVSDEDSGNPLKFSSVPESIESLALRSAGNFGNKPFTKKLASYIREWQFYDVSPSSIRQYERLPERIRKILKPKNHDKVPSLDNQAAEIQEILNYWAEKETSKLEEISKELQDYLNIRLTFSTEEEIIVKVLESDGKKMPLSSMSDGTLRLIAYLTLLYQSDENMPTLIGIEEPERNFHPGILKDIASVIKRLSKRTQVVITTHSSQLLDCFSPDEISSDISVILLSQKGESGTKACLLDKLAESREDLVDWMNDFGLGSAIYHSHLIEEILGS